MAGDKNKFDKPQPALPWTADEMMEILEGLATTADRLHVSYSEVAFIAREAAMQIGHMQGVLLAMRQAVYEQPIGVWFHAIDVAIGNRK